jgi:hypothetical protein
MTAPNGTENVLIHSDDDTRCEETVSSSHIALLIGGFPSQTLGLRISIKISCNFLALLH